MGGGDGNGDGGWPGGDRVNSSVEYERGKRRAS